MPHTPSHLAWCLLAALSMTLLPALAKSADQKFAVTALNGQIPTTAQCYTPIRENTNFKDLLATEVDAPTELIAYGESPLQYGELWLPKTVEPAPLIIFVHGGCWLSTYDIQHSHALSTGLSRSGYAVWSLEYRRTGDEGGGWPGSLDDVISGALYGLNHLTDRVDTHNTVLMGHSAGGHLALLAAGDARLQAHPIRAIGLAAIIDPKLYSQGLNSCESVTSDFMGGSVAQKPEAYAAATVIAQQLPEKTVLLIGGDDVIVADNQSRALAPREKHAIGITTVPRAGHFDFIDPHSWAFSEVLKTLAAVFKDSADSSRSIRPADDANHSVEGSAFSAEGSF